MKLSEGEHYVLLLDRLLTMLYFNQHGQPKSVENLMGSLSKLTNRSSVSQIQFSIPVVQAALNKLIKEGYVEEIKSSVSTKPSDFSITFDGMLYYQNAWISGSPFVGQLKKIKREKRIQTIKTVLLFLNSLAIIWIGWLTYKAQDKSNQLEKAKVYNERQEK
jgi:hypothetical protein